MQSNFYRIIYYINLLVFEFIINVIFILIFYRNSYNDPNSSIEYRVFLYWLKRLILVLLNIFIAFKLVPTINWQFKLLLGLIIGIGFQLISYLTKEIYYGAITILVIRYILKICCFELAIRIKIKKQLKDNSSN